MILNISIAIVCIVVGVILAEMVAKYTRYPDFSSYLTKKHIRTDIVCNISACPICGVDLLAYSRVSLFIYDGKWCVGHENCVSNTENESVKSEKEKG